VRDILIVSSSPVGDVDMHPVGAMTAAALFTALAFVVAKALEPQKDDDDD
jgi:hypothetical protein